MMDIVERLRKLADGERPYGSLLDVMDEAADEIEFLRKERDRLREALRAIEEIGEHLVWTVAEMRNIAMAALKENS
jgi:hypothetical protein